MYRLPGEVPGSRAPACGLRSSWPSRPCREIVHGRADLYRARDPDILAIVQRFDLREDLSVAFQQVGELEDGAFAVGWSQLRPRAAQRAPRGIDRRVDLCGATGRHGADDRTARGVEDLDAISMLPERAIAADKVGMAAAHERGGIRMKVKKRLRHRHIGPHPRCFGIRISGQGLGIGPHGTWTSVGRRACRPWATARSRSAGVSAFSPSTPKDCASATKSGLAPVWGYRRGTGVLPSPHRLNVRLPVAHRLWKDADVVVGIGTRLHMQQSMWGVDGRLKVVRIDIDPEEPDRFRPASVALVGDAARYTSALVAKLEGMALDRPSRANELGPKLIGWPASSKV
jgi:hypothetical protein